MRKRKILMNLLIALMLTVCGATFVACNTNEAKTIKTVTDTVPLTQNLLISNSDFKVGTSAKYPSSPKSWSGSAFSSSAYTTNIIAGIIDTSDDKYDKNKANWIPKNPKAALKRPTPKEGSKDSNMLMIYQPEKNSDLPNVDEAKKDIVYGPSAYQYKSNSFTIKKGYYYKLTVDVLTEQIAGKDGSDSNKEKPGATISVSSTAKTEFRHINTDGNWKTFEIYIEASKSKDNKLTLSLSLGYYSSLVKNELTTGYAFFDNLNLEKLEKVENKTAKQQYDEAVFSKDSLHKISYTVPNRTFEYGTKSASSTSSPSLWNLNVGGDKGDSAPSISRRNAIVETVQDDWAKYTTDLGYSNIYLKTSDLNDKGQKIIKKMNTANGLPKIGNYSDTYNSNVYMLSQSYPTSQIVSTSTPIVFEKGKTYKLQIPVYTYDIYGAGVSILLSGNKKDIGFENISYRAMTDSESEQFKNGEVMGKGATTGSWKLYTINVKGNAYRDMSFTLKLCLGTKGTKSNTKVDITKFNSSNTAFIPEKNDYSTFKSYSLKDGDDFTFSKGFAFFDDISLSSTTYNTSNKTVEFYGSEDQFKNIDGNTDDVMNLDLTQANGFNSNIENDSNWSINYDKNDSGEDLKTINGVSISDDTLAKFINTNSFPKNLTNPGMPYNTTEGTLINGNVLSLYNPIPQINIVKSKSYFNILPNTSYRISIWGKTFIDSSKNAKISILAKNDVEGEEDEVLAESTNINTNDYKNEFTNDWVEYVFLIRGKSNETISNAYIQISLGSGDKYSSTLAKGEAYFTNFNKQDLTNSEYVNASSNNTTKKVSKLDTDKSGLTIKNSAFNIFDLSKTEGLENGKLSTKLGYAQDWTLSSNKYADEIDYGIARFDTTDDGLKFVASNQITNIFGTRLGTPTSSIYDNWANLSGGPSCLVIDTNKAAADKKYALGYKSNKFKLSKLKNYSVSVYVKAFNGTKNSVYISTEDGYIYKGENEKYFINTPSDTEAVWNKYTFNIEVGLKDASMYLNLWLGENKDFTGTAEEESKTRGTVIFDSVEVKEIDSDTFESNKTLNNTKTLSFFTDGFDSEAKTSYKLVTPTSWNGKTTTGGNSLNTEHGIVNADGNVDIEALKEMYKLVVPSKSDDYFKSNTEYWTATNIDLVIAYLDNDKKYDDLSTEEKAVVDTYVNDNYATLLNNLKKDFANGNIQARTGNFMLSIYNKKDNAYSYTSDSYTLPKNKFYKISTWVKTSGVEIGKGAYVKLDVANITKESTNINTLVKGKNGNPDTNGWKEVVFYISTYGAKNDVSNLKLSLGLGKQKTETNSNTFVKGFAFFDDIAFETISEKAFEDQKVNDLDSFKINFEDISKTVDNEKSDKDTTKNVYKPDLKYLYWMIPTIIIAVLTILVIIVIFVRKFRKPRKQVNEFEITYSKNAHSAEELNKKKKEYDKFKE